MSTVETITGTAAAVYGVGMSLSPLLQMRAMWKSRSSKDQSIGYYWILCGGFVLWCLYGITKGDVFILVPNAVALATGIATLGMARYYRNKGDE